MPIGTEFTFGIVVCKGCVFVTIYDTDLKILNFDD